MYNCMKAIFSYELYHFYYLLFFFISRYLSEQLKN